MNAYDYSTHYQFVDAVRQKNHEFILAQIHSEDYPTKNPFSWTPLHYAVAFDNHELAKIILDNSKDDLNAADKYQRTALSIAARRGNPEILRLLLSKGADVTTGFPLCHAVVSENKACVVTLIQNGVNVDEIDEISHTLKYIPRYTPLIIAIEQSNTEIVQLLIQHGADINFGVDKHMTPLHYACQDKGTLEMVIALLSKGAKLDVRCQHDNLPLDYALLNNKFDIVKYLLESGASVNDFGKMGQTPLHTAVSCNMTDSVKLIVKYNADLNIQDIDGATPFYLCCYNWQVNEEIFELLIDSGADVTIKCKKSWTPLHLCCVVGNLKCVKLLLDKLSIDGVNAVTMDNITPLYLAACRGHTEVCKELLEHGAYTNIKINKYRDLCSFYPFDISQEDIKVGYTAVTIAAKRETRHVLDSFKENYAHINMENLKLIDMIETNRSDEISFDTLNLQETDLLGWTLLHYAVDAGNYYLTKILIDKIDDVNVADKYGRTPLTLAAASGNFTLVQLLSENGAKGNLGGAVFYMIENNHIECLKYLLNNNVVEAIDGRKRTPVMYAALKNNLPAMEALVNTSMDVTQKDEDNQTALHHACKSSREMVELLIKCGAHVNSQNCCEETPLFNAAVEKKYEVMEELLKHGADPNVCDHFMGTPLHHLAEYGTAKFVKKILEHSSEVTSVNAKDSESDTPFLLSPSNADIDVFRLLLKHGADLNSVLQGGWAALHICAYYSELAIAKELIKYNIDINALSQDGVSALYIAAASGHQSFVKMLIENGSLLDTPIMIIKDWREQSHIAQNLPRLEGATPLVAAICNGHIGIVKLLHLAGASIDLELPANMNPLQLAQANSHSQIVDYLTKHKNNS